MKKILFGLLLFFPLTSFAYTSADLTSPYANKLSDGKLVSGHSVITRLQSDPGGICYTSWRLKADGDVTWDSIFTYTGGQLYFKPDGTQFPVSTSTWFNSFTLDNLGNVGTHTQTGFAGKEYNTPHDIILSCVSQNNLATEYGPSTFDWIAVKTLTDTPTNACLNGNLTYAQCRSALGNRYFGDALLNPVWWNSNKAHALKNDNLTASAFSAAAGLMMSHDGPSVDGRLSASEEGTWQDKTNLNTSAIVDYGFGLGKLVIGSALGMFVTILPIIIALIIIGSITYIIFLGYRFLTRKL